MGAGVRALGGEGVGRAWESDLLANHRATVVAGHLLVYYIYLRFYD